MHKKKKIIFYCWNKLGECLNWIVFSLFWFGGINYSSMAGILGIYQEEKEGVYVCLRIRLREIIVNKVKNQFHALFLVTIQVKCKNCCVYTKKKKKQKTKI